MLRLAYERQCTVPRRQSYNLHPYVKSGVLTLALNGTLTSTDLVNVTVTVRSHSGQCVRLSLCVHGSCARRSLWQQKLTGARQDSMICMHTIATVRCAGGS